METAEKQFNKIPEELKKDYTDQYVLLGVLATAKKHGHQLQRMQIMKILQKVKKTLQDDFELQAYHKEFVKDKHGDFAPTVYDQLTDLKQSDFIASVGTEPYEKFYSTPLGEQIYDRIKMGSASENKKLILVRDLIEKLVPKEAPKTSEELRDENHQRKFILGGVEVSMDDLPKGEITTPNMDSGVCTAKSLSEKGSRLLRMKKFHSRKKIFDGCWA